MLSYKVQHKNNETKFILRIITLHRDVAAMNESRHATSCPCVFQWFNHLWLRKSCPCMQLIKHYTIKTYWRDEGTAPHISNLSSWWRWTVSFTPQPLHPCGNSPWYPLARRMGTPRAHLDTIVKRRISAKAEKWTLILLLLSPQTNHYAD
jgi:hypothetical protein